MLFIENQTIYVPSVQVKVGPTWEVLVSYTKPSDKFSEFSSIFTCHSLGLSLVTPREVTSVCLLLHDSSTAQTTILSSLGPGR